MMNPTAIFKSHLAYFENPTDREVVLLDILDDFYRKLLIYSKILENCIPYEGVDQKVREGITVEVIDRVSKLHELSSPDYCQCTQRQKLLLNEIKKFKVKEMEPDDDGYGRYSVLQDSSGRGMANSKHNAINFRLWRDVINEG